MFVKSCPILGQPIPKNDFTDRNEEASPAELDQETVALVYSLVFCLTPKLNLPERNNESRARPTNMFVIILENCRRAASNQPHQL